MPAVLVFASVFLRRGAVPIPHGFSSRLHAGRDYDALRKSGALPASQDTEASLRSGRVGG